MSGRVWGCEKFEGNREVQKIEDEHVVTLFCMMHGLRWRSIGSGIHTGYWLDISDDIRQE